MPCVVALILCCVRNYGKVYFKVQHFFITLWRMLEVEFQFQTLRGKFINQKN